ncbi:MAG: hypothetical protein SF052_13635 [Bacteroidia bacterium]|nr:hypothetical protein [Bacteroidia bacterium]
MEITFFDSVSGSKFIKNPSDIHGMSFSDLRNNIWIFYVFLPLISVGQGADFATDQFYSISNTRTVVNSGKINARAQLYSYETTLSLVIEVHDEDVNIDPENSENTDHVEVWFALPQSAYPPNFEYHTHPKYVSFIPESTRSEEPADPRFFSVFSEYGNITSVGDFVNKYDYPKTADIRKDSLNIPERKNLQTKTVPFGIVHFGFFPDGRKVVHYNKSELELVGDALNIGIGNLAEGIDYVAEINEREDGYTINARITPQALGFVQLPQMDQIRFLVDIADNGSLPSAPANVILSSSRTREEGVPATFNQVVFQKPLRTNTTRVPNDFFRTAGITPIYVYGNAEWISADVDVDGIVYREQEISQALSEVKFSRVPYRFEVTQPLGLQVSTLLMEYDYVNLLPIEKEFVRVGEKMIEVERAKNSHFPDGQNRRNVVFRFPDNIPGIIIRESSYRHPYGWDDCNKCVVETIHLRRITKEEVYGIMSINQVDGPEAFCEIGEFKFDGYYVNQMDWIQSGKILVIRLTHYNGKEQKRIKLSWEKDGSNPKVEWIR